MKGKLLPVAIFVGILPAAIPAFANTSPTGSPGRPGAFNGTSCQLYTSTPGASANAPGSIFNPSGTAGNV